MVFGPIQIFAFGFPDTAGFEGRIAEELIRLSEAGTIRIIDALAVVAEGDEVDILRVSDLDEEQREELGMQVGALMGLGMAGLEGMVAGAEAGAEIAEEGGLGIVEAIGEEFIENLPDGAAALLLIIEHAWAVPLRDAVVDAGGLLIGNQWIGAQDLVALGAALGIAAAQESESESDD
ncbi:MAG: hypothetical protein PVG27_09925 [Chloroflexota bacterium]|jgi:uncharacterized membrane protein